MTERELANRERRRCWVRTVVDFCYSYDSDNIAAFCRERGISAPSFKYWSNRIRLGLYEQGIEKGFFKEMRVYPTLPIMLDVLHNNGYAMDEDGYLVQREYRLEPQADGAAQVFQPVSPDHPVSTNTQKTQQLMAKVSGIGENTLRRLMADNQIEYLQIGSHRLLAVEAIWEYYNRNKRPIACCKHEDIHFGYKDQRAS